MSNIVQKTIDDFWEHTLFKIVPTWIKPNTFTIIRLLCIPFILYCLLNQMFVSALFYFIIGSLCDSIDGALARKRNQTSKMGVVLDPLADKLMIILFILFVSEFYPYQDVLLVIAGLSTFTILLNTILILAFPQRGTIQADWWGKLKMTFEVIGLVLILIYIIFNSYTALSLSLAMLYLAILFEIISLVSYLYQFLRNK
ncbi:MAG: CDP-alcohol phosphatidyltransferase family protein [Patescibacteria group bacterium]|jgi:CDP-diacylglycerol--glycerol-3-phosphate 3-phosphatidyltransferase